MTKKLTDDLKKNFEELEKITDELQSEELDLEKSLDKFERGLILAERLKTRLAEIENKIEKVKIKFSKSDSKK